MKIKTDIQKWREDESRRREEHKASLEKKFGIKGNPKADRLYEIAWDIGHGSGYREVAIYYEMLVDLVK